jgi:hypothetical protein
MNRIYQGKVTNVEIAARHILSASTGERTEVRCRNQNPWLPFDPNPKQAKAKWQAALWQHHQLPQVAVN